MTSVPPRRASLIVCAVPRDPSLWKARTRSGPAASISSLRTYPAPSVALPLGYLARGCLGPYRKGLSSLSNRGSPPQDWQTDASRPATAR